MRMPAWITGTLLLSVTFAAGIAVGVAYQRRQIPSHGSVAADAHDAVHHLARELDLDPAQQRAISEILARHQADVDATWHAMQPHVRATLESISQEIVAVLRPDQAAKFRNMTESMHPATHR